MSEEPKNLADSNPDLAEKDKPNNIEAINRRRAEALNEAKKAKEEARAYKAKLEKIEQDRLEAQGKYQDINKTLKEQLAEQKKQNEETVKRFRLNTIKSAIKTKGLEAGCKKPDVLLRLLEKEEQEAITVDDSFSVDMSSLDPIMDRLKGDYEELFTKTSTPTKDIPPTRHAVEPQSRTEEEHLVAYLKGKGLE